MDYYLLPVFGPAALVVLAGAALWAVGFYRARQAAILSGERAPRPNPMRVAVFAYGVMIVAMVIFAVLSYLRATAIESWRTGTATITKTWVERQTSSSQEYDAQAASGRRTKTEVWWQLNVAYDYEVDGEPHSGEDRLGFDTEAEAEEAGRTYLAAATHEVRFDPQAPDDSVLFLSTRDPARALILLAFVVIGGGASLFVLRRRSLAENKRRPKDGTRPSRD